MAASELIFKGEKGVIKMGCKHYDNKRDLLRQMKVTQARTENAMAAMFSAYMTLATLTLYEDLSFRDKRLKDFVDGIYKRLEDYEKGTLTLDDMQKTLYEKAGVVIEPPRVRNTETIK